jgi:NAD(P)H-flavin reductase
MTPLDLVPHPATIESIAPESADTRTFVLRPEPSVAAFDRATPGQFAMLSVFGHGEAAFTFSGLPGAGGTTGAVVLTVRRMGELTGALFALDVGASVGLRGPFGRGFPFDGDVPTIYVGGGCGLTPLRAAILRDVATRRVPRAVVYGAADPDARIHRGDLAAWSCDPDTYLVDSVQNPCAGWRGRVGLVTSFLEEAVDRIGARRAAVCGPAEMLPLVGERLCRAGLDPGRIHLALERYMKCGTGHCGHCYVDHRYVCTNGPVFSLAELRTLPEAFVPAREAWSAGDAALCRGGEHVRACRSRAPVPVS